MKRICIVLLVSLAAFGCEEKLKPSVVTLDQTAIPSQESWNSTVTFSDSAKVKAVLWVGHIAVYSAQQYTLLSDSLHVDFFDELEYHTSVLTAQRGRVNDRTQDFTAYENVVVNSDSGVVLRTDSLFWNNTTRKIQTNAFVEIISSTERIMGHGLVSDQGLKNYKIFRVTGRTVMNE